MWISFVRPESRSRSCCRFRAKLSDANVAAYTAPSTSPSSSRSLATSSPTSAVITVETGELTNSCWKDSGGIVKSATSRVPSRAYLPSVRIMQIG